MMNKKQDINMPVDNAGYTPLYNQHLLIEEIKNTLTPIVDNWNNEYPLRSDLSRLLSVAKKIEKSHNEMQLNMLRMFAGGNMYAERGKKDTR